MRLSGLRRRVAIADRILAVKAADMGELAGEIGRWVYALYWLTAEVVGVAYNGVTELMENQRRVGSMR